MPEFKTGFGVSQPIIGIFDPIVDENNEIRKYKERNKIQTVITDEPTGKILSYTYKVICSECGKIYDYKASSDEELEIILRKEGWRSSLNLEKAYCPFCITKTIKQELK
ncbi:MAG: hypothetical protein LBF97_07010 [Elusimicrobiota bacterium]|jgi:hypothetical protein|nr:hypothetical protein [Elusimicrobiota bacterium]